MKAVKKWFRAWLGVDRLDAKVMDLAIANARYLRVAQEASDLSSQAVELIRDHALLHLALAKGAPSPTPGQVN